MVKLAHSLFASRRGTLFCLSKIKYPNKKDTPPHGLRLPCATQHKGSNRKLASLKQPLAELPFMSPLLCVVQGAGSTKYSYSCSFRLECWHLEQVCTSFLSTPILVIAAIIKTGTITSDFPAPELEKSPKLVKSMMYKYPAISRPPKIRSIFNSFG